MADLPPLPQGIRDIFDLPSADWMDRARRAIGDIDITYLDSAQNLADLPDVAAARVNLGVEIGVDVQGYDAGLASIAGLTTAADTMVYTTAADTYATTALTAAGRALLDDASASAQRTTMGVAIGSDVQAWSAVLDATTASFTTADETKLDGIETAADVTDTANVTSAGALMDSELADIAAVKALNQGVATSDTPTFAALEVSGTQVVGAQGAAVSDASGGSTVDTEARAAINALLARLRTHGLIAT